MSDREKTTDVCQGYIFDPDRQALVPTSHAQHKFSLQTRRCVRCNLHEFHLPALPYCPKTEPMIRRIEKDGIIIEGPDTTDLAGKDTGVEPLRRSLGNGWQPPQAREKCLSRPPSRE